MTTLPDYIAAHLRTPFEWGAHDCVTFAVGWLEIRSGRDYLSQYRPWTSRAEAHAIIESLGGLEHMFDTNLTRIAPGFAQDGDITLVGGTAYLFSGAYLVGPGETGLDFRTRMEATCAWRL